MNVTQLFNQYLASQKLERNTQRNYTSAMKDVLAVVGTRPVTALTQADYETVKAALRHKKPSTANFALTVFKTIVKHSVDLGVHIDSPFVRARGVKQNYTPRNFLSRAERDEVLEKCTDPAHKLMIAMAALTGVRKSELFALRWDDIDLEAKTLTVRRTMERPGQVKEYAKTTSSLRVIPLPEKLFSLLNKSEGYIFSPTVSEFDNPTDNILKKYTDKDVCWHSLRNTFASALVEKNVSLIKIAWLLGHSKVSATLYRYARVHSTSQLHEEVNLI
jgi:integrase